MKLLKAMLQEKAHEVVEDAETIIRTKAITNDLDGGSNGPMITVFIITCSRTCVLTVHYTAQGPILVVRRFSHPLSDLGSIALVAPSTSRNFPLQP